MTSAAYITTAQRPAGPVLVGHQDDRVLLHMDRPLDFMNVSGAEALTLAYQLVAAARAAGACAVPQRNLF